MCALRILGLSLWGVSILLSRIAPCEAQHVSESRGRCSRIVSVAPSVTEILFSLSLGEKVIGVTRYCRFPEAALEIPKIGGFLDPNLESIVALRPSVVFLLKEQRELSRALKKLQIDSLMVDHGRVEGILSSIRAIGGHCGQGEQSEALAAALQQQVAAVQERVRGFEPVRTMVVVGRGGKENQSVFVAGRDGFLDDLVSRAGGKNVNPSTTIAFPIMSAEAVLSVNPEVIIEVIVSEGFTERKEQELRESWRRYPEIQAVADNRVHVFSQPELSIPGPRFPMVLERIAMLLHPGAVE